MSQELATRNDQTTVAVWDDQQTIKNLFAKDLTPAEFDVFMQMGMALKANPFTREIWAVKYGNSAAQIFCGRDFYRRKGQEQPDYEMHLAEAIYANDSFQVVNGEVKHSYNFMNRGKLVGAYFQLWRKGSPKSFFHSVKFEEYSTGKSLWQSKPETMIKKVAEAQGFRMAYQGLFRGTYDESEKWQEITDPITIAYQTNPVTGNRNMGKLPEPGETSYYWQGKTHFFGYDGQWHDNKEDAILDPVTGVTYGVLEDGDTPIYEQTSARNGQTRQGAGTPPPAPANKLDDVLPPDPPEVSKENQAILDGLNEFFPTSNVPAVAKLMALEKKDKAAKVDLIKWYCYFAGDATQPGAIEVLKKASEYEGKSVPTFEALAKASDGRVGATYKEAKKALYNHLRKLKGFEDEPGK